MSLHGDSKRRIVLQPSHPRHRRDPLHGAQGLLEPMGLAFGSFECLGHAGVGQRQQDTVKNLAFVVALLILGVGVGIGILAPSGRVWIGQLSVTSGAFYVIATVRVFESPLVSS